MTPLLRSLAARNSVVTATSPRAAVEAVRRERFDTVLVDVCAAEGASQPWLEELERAAQGAKLVVAALPRMADVTPRTVQEAEPLLPGWSPAWRTALDRAEQLATGDVPILILGEPGCEVEVLARSIHLRSARRTLELTRVAANAPPRTVETALFGLPSRRGSVLIEDIPGLPVALQAKLARAIASAKLGYRVMATMAIYPGDASASTPLIADLAAVFSDGIIRVPPLRERRADIRRIVAAHVAGTCRGAGRPAPKVAEDALALLEAHPWPGNTRELATVIERAVLASSGLELRAADFGLAG